MPHLLTVFRIDEDKNYDVDVAILQALLKGMITSQAEHAHIRPFLNLETEDSNSHFQAEGNWIMLMMVLDN